MYTELNWAFSLKRHTPEEVEYALLFMTGQDDGKPESLPSHPLFGTARWRDILRSAGKDSQAPAWLELADSGRYRVSIRCVLTGYDAEIIQFIHWITPYIFARPGDFIGYTRSEDVEPVTLLLYPNRTFTPQRPDEIDGEPV